MLTAPVTESVHDVFSPDTFAALITFSCGLLPESAALKWNCGEFVRTRNVAVATKPVAWPVAVTVRLPGSAAVGTLNVDENAAVDDVVVVATFVDPKRTTTPSLTPSPSPDTVTLVVGGPAVGFTEMVSTCSTAEPRATLPWTSVRVRRTVNAPVRPYRCPGRLLKLDSVTA